MKITWNTQNVTLPALDFRSLEEWLPRVAASYGCTIGRLNYVFTDDPAILDLNIRALGHDYFTDVITFDYTAGNVVSGDIYISIDTVRSNAEGLHAGLMEELLRVIVHGLLHLCGIDDKGPGQREIMEGAENNALAMLHNTAAS